MVTNVAGYPAVYWVMMVCAVLSAMLSWATTAQRRPDGVRDMARNET